MRRAQLAQHGRCGDSVGWGDHRSERNRRRPWHRRHEVVRDDGDRGGRESNREYDQARYRRPVVPEVPQGRVVRSVEQDGRDEDRQHKSGWNAERRGAWKKREQRAAKCEKYGIRCSDATRSGRQKYRRDEKNKKLFELPHIPDIAESRSFEVALRAKIVRFSKPLAACGSSVVTTRRARVIAGDDGRESTARASTARRLALL